MTEHVVADPGRAAALLGDPRLVPPPPPAARRPVLALWGAMARFSGPEDHAGRRRAVVAALDALDLDAALAVAAVGVRRRLDGREVDGVADIARVVPVEAVAAGLGIEGDPAEVVADVDAVVEVIGRGRAASPGADAAVERLGARLPAGAGDPVPALSLLYQTVDATAAAVGAALHARARGVAPVAAVPRTRRVARSAVDLGPVALAAGDEVVLALGRAELPFGAGPHACPGRALAEGLVEVVVAAVGVAGYQVGLADVLLDADGRPLVLPLRPGGTGPAVGRGRVQSGSVGTARPARRPS